MTIHSSHSDLRKLCLFVSVSIDDMEQEAMQRFCFYSVCLTFIHRDDFLKCNQEEKKSQII